MKIFEGNVLFLDRSDINTDEIIPAKYLTEITKEALKPHLFEDLKLEGFDPNVAIKSKGVVVSLENFGCGSSREHAPWAIEQNGINVVIAENFARIFRQNMYNCGMMAIELPKATIKHIFEEYSNKNPYISVDVEAEIISVSTNDTKKDFKFTIPTFDKALVESGGWVDFVDQKY